jgi:hypothetical protein
LGHGQNFAPILMAVGKMAEQAANILNPKSR